MSDPGSRDDPHAGERRAPSRHETAQHNTAQHDIASLALGEHVDPTIDEHVRTCVACRRDLDAYRQVTELARTSKHAADVPAAPPPQVWDRIATELGLADLPAGPVNTVFATTPVPDDPFSEHPVAEPPPAVAIVHTLRWRRALLVAAAVVALAGSGVAGWAIGHRTSTTAAARSSQAVLAAQPGTPQTAHGKAVVHTSADGYTLSVTASELPAPTGYYEVWLFNPSINQMVAVGTLGAGDRGSFTVPDGIDLRAYHVVDISAQKYDGNNTHERSVLRGPLAP